MTLERPRFTTTSLREGYDMAEVDQAIDVIFDNLALAEVRFGPERIAELRFTPVRLRQGYDINQVDQWLDLAAAETARRAGGGLPPEQAPEAEPPSAVAAAHQPTQSTAITEVSSGGPGLYLILVAILVVVGVVVYALVA